MVEIQPPIDARQAAQQVAVGSPQVDSEAITEEAIAAEPADQIDPSSVPRGFGADETLAPDPRINNEVPLGGPVSPSWQSERQQRSRQIALIVAIAGSGLIASAILFGWFVKNWQSKDAAVAGVVDSGTNDNDANNPSDAVVDADEQAESGSIAEELRPEEQAGSTSQSTDLSDQSNAPATSDPRQTSLEVDPDAKMSEPVANMNDAKVPADLLQPSALDPLGLDTPPKDTSFPTGPTQDPKEPDGPIDVPDELKGLMGVLNLSGGQDTFDLDAPPSLDDVKLEGPARENIDPMMIANPPEPINFKRALSMKLALAPTKNDAYPLSDLVLLISQISGVPIQIDWVSFDLMGINIRDDVTNLRANGWRSVDDLLNRIAASINGEITRTETLLTLAPTEEAFKEKLDMLLDMSDFGAGQPTAVATVNAFLVGSQQPGANAKKVKAGVERHDHQVAALAVESMRRLRGKNGKLPDVVFARWAQSTIDKRLDWPIVAGGNSNAPLLSPLTIAGVLRRLGRSNGATCFVNWLDANRRGMAPQQLVMPFMKSNAGDTLSQLLTPFELQVRSVDDHHWWVGTQATYDRFPVIVSSQPLGKSKDEFARRIAKIAGADETKFAIDPDTGKAIMLLPRYIVRQLPELTKGLQ
jgi:hypothetical protein